jgi:hypothetical protein
MGGLVQTKVKQLYGARFATPSVLKVDTHATGLGTMQDFKSL